MSLERYRKTATSALVVGHFCAIAVGTALGLIGGGGAILAVPILIYVIGVEVKGAIAISLISVGMVSLIGTYLHWQKGNVRPGIALLFAPTAMIGAYGGALIAALPWVSEAFQLFCFSLTMLAVSLLMIAKRKRKQQKVYASYPKSTHAPLTNSEQVSPHRLAILSEGLGIGLLTGFVGVGGGFAIVPALVLLTNIPMKQAVGTSLMIISMKSVTGFVGYLGQINIDWTLVGSFSLAACGGTLLGSYLNQFIDASALQAGFGYFVLAFAILMLIAQT